MKLNDRNDVTLDLIREIGFDNVNRIDGNSSEKVFFLGPTVSSRTIGAHATEAAIKEFVAYWTNQIKCAEAYLESSCSNVTSDWK